jgi:hypothetical protein
MGGLYQEHHDDDFFLYIAYSDESVYGREWKKFLGGKLDEICIVVGYDQVSYAEIPWCALRYFISFFAFASFNVLRRCNRKLSTCSKTFF